MLYGSGNRVARQKVGKEPNGKSEKKEQNFHRVQIYPRCSKVNLERI